MRRRAAARDRPAASRPSRARCGSGCGMMLPLVAAAIVVTLAEGPCDILGAAGNPCVAAHRCTHRSSDTHRYCTVHGSLQRAALDCQWSLSAPPAADRRC